MNKIRILLVEDEGIVAMDLKRHLNNFDYEVVGVAAKGTKAIELAEVHRPALVLMDIQLKGDMDGIQAADIIRQRFDIPVIFLTAFDDKLTLERAKTSEAFGYILKPYHEREIHTTIEMALYKHRMEKKLRDNERWLDTTINNIRDGVITAEKDGKIISANASAEKMLGRNDLAGKNIDEIVYDNIEYERQEAADKPPYCFLLVSDKQIPVELIDTELKDGKGNLVGKLVLLHDYTDRFTYELALQEAKGMAERANKVKGDFLATVTHELRTPLNSILGMADILLENTEGSPELHENLSIIKKSGESLLNVINSMLQVVKSGNEKGKEAEQEEISLLELLKIVFDANTGECSKKGLVFQCILQSNSPQNVFCGKQLILDVFNEIIKNAVRFTETGSIILKMGIEDWVESGGRIRLQTEILDTGKGLPADELETIFEPFMQVEDIYTRLHGGTGLGLTIVKQKVEILGGTIRAECRDGGGSVFHIILPCSVIDEAVIETDYVLSNKEKEGSGEPLPGTHAEEQRHFEKFLLDLKRHLEDNDIETLEAEAEKMKKIFEKNEKKDFQEAILKILLACRRNDLDSLDKIIEANFSVGEL